MAAWFLWVDRPHHQAPVFGTVDRREDRRPVDAMEFAELALAQ